MSYRKDVLDATANSLPWDKLSGCNILITGATGLIGSCLVDVLMSKRTKDYHIHALGRNETRAKKLFSRYWNDKSFHFIKHDIIDPLPGCQEFEYIIHAASNASPASFVSNPVEIIKANIIGICNLMDYGISHQLKRFLYLSSGEVYGEGDGRVFSEDYSGYVNPLLVRSCYPSSKRTGETLCISYSHEYGIETVIARLSHIYGPFFSDNDNRVYAEFIRNVLRDEDIVLKSAGTQFRSWCYVVDCVSALLFVLLKGENGKAYNVADGSSNITIKDLAELIASLCNKKIVFDFPSKMESMGFNPVTKSVFSTELLSSLGWTITGTMKEKMKSTIEAMKRGDNASVQFFP